MRITGLLWTETTADDAMEALMEDDERERCHSIGPYALDCVRDAHGPEVDHAHEYIRWRDRPGGGFTQTGFPDPEVHL